MVIITVVITVPTIGVGTGGAARGLGRCFVRMREPATAPTSVKDRSRRDSGPTQLPLSHAATPVWLALLDNMVSDSLHRPAAGVTNATPRRCGMALKLVLFKDLFIADIFHQKRYQETIFDVSAINL